MTKAITLTNGWNGKDKRKTIVDIRIGEREKERLTGWDYERLVETFNRLIEDAKTDDESPLSVNSISCAIDCAEIVARKVIRQREEIAMEKDPSVIRYNSSPCFDCVQRIEIDITDRYDRDPQAYGEAYDNVFITYNVYFFDWSSGAAFISCNLEDLWSEVTERAYVRSYLAVK